MAQKPNNLLSDRLPQLSLWAAVGLTAGLLGLLIRSSWGTAALLGQLAERELLIERVCGEIIHLDEVLTMSARVASTTGDLAWKVRYDEHVVMLDAALEVASQLAPGAEELAGTAQTDAANNRLIAAETAAFELIAEGQATKARELLDSPEYAQDKAIYGVGMKRFLDAMRARTDELLSRERTASARQNMLLSSGVPLLVTLWVLIACNLRTTQRVRRQQAKKLSEHAAALTRSNLKIEQASKARGEFLARMSHEIRTPLHGMLGVTEILGEGELSEKQRELTGLVRRCGEHLHTIVDDILDSSKLEAGKVQLISRPVDLRELASDVLEVLRPRAADKGLELVLEIADGLPSHVQLDPVRTRQILLNVVGNAVKFTGSGLVAVSIKGESPDEDHLQLTIEVRDTGAGIPPNRLKAVFELFEQASAETSNVYGGSGLGLPIARSLARLAGGDLTASSELGIGTTFQLELPTRIVHEPTPEPLAALPSQLNLRLLVAEDDPTNALVSRRQLEGLGCEVVVAVDGFEAVERWREGQFDAVLMDCHMPGLDGFEATRRIRNEELERKGPRTPVLALTASVFPGDREACQEAGLDELITKPFNSGQIARHLQNWTGPEQPSVQVPAQVPEGRST